MDEPITKAEAERYPHLRGAYQAQEQKRAEAKAQGRLCEKCGVAIVPLCTHCAAKYRADKTNIG